VTSCKGNVIVGVVAAGLAAGPGGENIGHSGELLQAGSLYACHDAIFDQITKSHVCP